LQVRARNFSGIQHETSQRSKVSPENTLEFSKLTRGSCNRRLQMVARSLVHLGLPSARFEAASARVRGQKCETVMSDSGGTAYRSSILA